MSKEFLQLLLPVSINLSMNKKSNINLENLKYDRILLKSRRVRKQF